MVSVQTASWGSFRFSTDGLPEAMRAKAVRELHERAALPGSIEPLEALPNYRVRVDIAKQALPGLGINCDGRWLAHGPKTDLAAFGANGLATERSDHPYPDRSVEKGGRRCHWGITSTGFIAAPELASAAARFDVRKIVTRDEPVERHPARHEKIDEARDESHQRNHKVQYSVSKRLYALRSRIECFVGHLKEQRRIATRYNKTASSFLGFVLLGCIGLRVRFVHQA